MQLLNQWPLAISPRPDRITLNGIPIMRRTSLKSQSMEAENQLSTSLIRQDRLNRTQFIPGELEIIERINIIVQLVNRTGPNQHRSNALIF